MKNALIVGYFKCDKALGEFYSSYVVSARKRGYTIRGIELGGRAEGSTCDFAIISLCEAFGKMLVLKELVLLPFVRFFNPDIFVYNSMQNQADSFQNWLKSYIRLRVFKRRFKLYVREQNVRHVLLNHQFSGYHLIALEICRKLSIPFAFWHPGFLPGTMSFDYSGMLAESEFHEELEGKGLELRSDWLELGEKYVEQAKNGIYLRPGKSSRVDEEVMQFVQKQKQKFSKILLVIGCNDYRTGVLPRDYVNSDLHSRFYKSSDCLFEDVVSVAGDDVFVVYKPHPNVYTDRSGVEVISAKSAIVFDLPLRHLLEQVDASVTICSSGAYESLIANVPAILVGRLPGFNLGFFYVLGEGSEQLGSHIADALRDGISEDARRIFFNFIGYSLSNYFFSHGVNSCPFTSLNFDQAIAQCFSRASHRRQGESC